MTGRYSLEKQHWAHGRPAVGDGGRYKISIGKFSPIGGILDSPVIKRSKWASWGDSVCAFPTEVEKKGRLNVNFPVSFPLLPL